VIPIEECNKSPSDELPDRRMGPLEPFKSADGNAAGGKTECCPFVVLEVVSATLF